MGESQKKTVIKPKTGWFEIDIKELVRYRYLVFMFVKRNFSVQYKQTILGPLWFIINPLLTTGMFTFVFGKVAGIPTDGVPQFLFYMSGNTFWSFFATCLTSTSSTFTNNAGLFGKIYFPRLTVPVSTVIFSGISFLIQLGMLICFTIYYAFSGAEISVHRELLLLPVWMIQIALLGLGVGILISSLTTKYRDFTILVSFGVQLWMYVTPVVYPVSSLSGRRRFILLLNPVAPIINNFRYALLGCGTMEWGYWLVSLAITTAVLAFGIIIFSRVEKDFMDTV